MKNKFSIIILALIASLNVVAQEEAEIRLGDSLQFTGCSDANFIYTDHYRKTRFEDSTHMNYPMQEGWDFYQYFLVSGDFDIQRLPCSYNGKIAVVKHMMAVETDSGEYQTVVLAMFDDQSVAYIIDKAFTEGEILYIPKE